MNWIYLIFIVVGILSVFAFPKILKFILFGLITYLTIMKDLYYAVAFIPYLLLIIYFKWRKKNG
jgi:hypothetical protein